MLFFCGKQTKCWKIYQKCFKSMGKYAKSDHTYNFDWNIFDNWFFIKVRFSCKNEDTNLSKHVNSPLSPKKKYMGPNNYPTIDSLGENIFPPNLLIHEVVHTCLAGWRRAKFWPHWVLNEKKKGFFLQTI